MNVHEEHQPPIDPSRGVEVKSTPGSTRRGDRGKGGIEGEERKVS